MTMVLRPTSAQHPQHWWSKHKLVQLGESAHGIGHEVQSFRPFGSLLAGANQGTSEMLQNDMETGHDNEHKTLHKVELCQNEI